jgi:hypothetical protein
MLANFRRPPDRRPRPSASWRKQVGKDFRSPLYRHRQAARHAAHHHRRKFVRMLFEACSTLVVLVVSLFFTLEFSTWRAASPRGWAVQRRSTACARAMPATRIRANGDGRMGGASTRRWTT